MNNPKILQWDRYCLENYLIDRKALFDQLTELNVQNLVSRGTFEDQVKSLAVTQLNEFVAKEVYATLEPESPGLRSTEIARKEYPAIAETLANRLASIKSELDSFNDNEWKDKFIQLCQEKHAEQTKIWNDSWNKVCNGKRLIDDIYRHYTVKQSKFEFKRAIARRIKSEQSEDWTLVRAKISDALSQS